MCVTVRVSVSVSNRVWLIVRVSGSLQVRLGSRLQLELEFRLGLGPGLGLGLGPGPEPGLGLGLGSGSELRLCLLLASALARSSIPNCSLIRNRRQGSRAKHILTSG